VSQLEAAEAAYRATKEFKEWADWMKRQRQQQEAAAQRKGAASGNRDRATTGAGDEDRGGDAGADGDHGQPAADADAKDYTVPDVLPQFSFAATYDAISRSGELKKLLQDCREAGNAKVDAFEATIEASLSESAASVGESTTPQARRSRCESVCRADGERLPDDGAAGEERIAAFIVVVDAVKRQNRRRGQDVRVNVDVGGGQEHCRRGR
jgi:hypothetical protein